MDRRHQIRKWLGGKGEGDENGTRLIFYSEENLSILLTLRPTRTRRMNRTSIERWKTPYIIFGYEYLSARDSYVGSTQCKARE